MVDRLLTQKEQPHLDTEQMEERRIVPSLSGDDRVDWDVRQVSKSKSPSVTKVYLNHQQVLSYAFNNTKTRQILHYTQCSAQFLLHLKV